MSDEIDCILQDNSGKIAAGSIVKWTEEKDRNLSNVTAGDYQEYCTWVAKSDISYPFFSRRDFVRGLGWLTDEQFAADAHELFTKIEKIRSD